MIRAYDDKGNVVDLVAWEKQIRADTIDEIYNKIDEGVCDICEYKGFECVRECSSQNYEMQTLLKWLEQQMEGGNK